MSIDHYTVPIPASAYICPDWTSLIEEVHTKWSHSMLDKKYGGYVIEDKGAIVLVCTDELCTILEEKDRQAQTVTFHDPASDAVSLANYTVDIPLSARICSDWPSLEAAVVQRPGCRIVEKYGGFVLLCSLVMRRCLRKSGVLKISLAFCMTMSRKMHLLGHETSRMIYVLLEYVYKHKGVCQANCLFR
jgi:hypothetical protein